MTGTKTQPAQLEALKGSLKGIDLSGFKEVVGPNGETYKTPEPEQAGFSYSNADPFAHDTKGFTAVPRCASGLFLPCTAGKPRYKALTTREL